MARSVLQNNTIREAENKIEENIKNTYLKVYKLDCVTFHTDGTYDKEAVKDIKKNQNEYMWFIPSKDKNETEIKYGNIEKDIKSESYNPLLKQYKYNNQDIKAFKDSIKEEVRTNLLQALSQSTGSLELLRLKNKGIIYNVAYEGLYEKTERVLNCITNEKRSCIRDEESIRGIGY